MVTFSNLVVVLSAIVTGSLASPAPGPSSTRSTRNVAAEHGAAPDFVLPRTNNSSTVHRRQTVDYDQDYVTGDTVDYVPDGSYFSVNWDTEDDFVVGVGWATGDTTPITYSGSFSVGSGVGLLSVYGWSTSPLVEYYIIEDLSGESSFGTVKGSVTSDGSSYTIWENQRVNEPSIQGTATFNQYISVRASPRTSGTVTLENHFAAWAALGMDLGTFNYQVIAVEGWAGSGSAGQSVSK